MADDLVGVKYRAKFVVQILCAAMLIAGGVWLNDLNGLLWIGELPVWLAWPLTVLLVVFIINAINLIDGIDGLASGLSAIACLIFGCVFAALSEWLYAMISFATLGVLVPFFYYNVFGNPEKQQKIFMGDTGSLTIGMILCFLSMKLAMGAPVLWDSLRPNPVVLAFSPLLVPCCDVVRVYFHRLKCGRNPFLPDKNHLHHKLLAAGLSQRLAMMAILGASMLLTAVNVALSLWINVNYILVLNILIWVAFNHWMAKYELK